MPATKDFGPALTTAPELTELGGRFVLPRTQSRFQVVVGFVDGDACTTRVRRLAGSEVVDSVGTGTGSGG